MTADREDDAAGDCEQVALPPEPTLTPTETQPQATPAPAPVPTAVGYAIVAPDRTPPKLAVTAQRRPRFGAAARVTCSEACTIKAELHAGHVLGRAQKRLPRADSVKLTITPKRRPHAKRVRATLVITATDVDGNARRVSRALTLRA